MKQTIDISPEKIGPIAAAGIRFLNLETTLLPGNLKQQLAVLEVLLSGLAAGELVLATPPRAPVESDATGSDKEPDLDPGRFDPPRRPKMLLAERKELATAAATLPGLSGEGEGQSG